MGNYPYPTNRRRRHRPENRVKIFEEIDAEREVQNKEWGDQRHSPGYWRSIVGEEIGEADEQLNNLYYFEEFERNAGHLTPGQQAAVLRAKKELREELIQAAASIVAWLEDIDRE